jgi:hypothetical protein
LISCLGGGVALTSGVGFGVVTGSRWGVDTGVGLGVEISRGVAFISGVGFSMFAGWCGVEVGFGVVRFAGPAWGVVSGFLSGVGVTIVRGVAETWGVSPAGAPPDFGVAVGDGFTSGEVNDFGAFRFGGTDFWTLGDVPGTAPVGDCFGPGTVGVVGLPPVGEGPGVPPGLIAGETPGVPPGFTAGDAPGVPTGFTPSRFGGTDFLPATAGEPPGVILALGVFGPEPVPGFTKLGGICFCPATAFGEPVG